MNDSDSKPQICAAFLNYIIEIVRASGQSLSVKPIISQLYTNRNCFQNSFFCLKFIKLSKNDKYLLTLDNGGGIL